jgi:hypothetical protein
MLANAQRHLSKALSLAAQYMIEIADQTAHNTNGDLGEPSAASVSRKVGVLVFVSFLACLDKYCWATLRCK